MFYYSYLFKHGKKIILFIVILYFIGYLFGLFKLKILAICILIYTYYFFRIPRFDTMLNDDLVYAPSFGKVRSISKKNIDGEEYIHIATFISIFDPHIQYSPVNGFLTGTKYIKGNFYPAMILYKSNHNERMHYFVNTKHGRVIFTQIAGMIAKTIVPFKQKGLVKQGEEIGLIQFGSRCDVFIPNKKNLQILVKEGDYVKGGQSIVGKFL